jgi:hypothetical protein
MAYTPVPTQSTGDSWTAAEHNTYIRDNFAASVPDVFTTKGDIFLATGADAGAILAVGTDGQLLSANSTTATGWQWTSPATAQAHARYKVSAATNCVNATPTIINFDTLVYDTDSAVTIGAAWKFTVPASHDGYYMVAAAVTLVSDTGWAAGEYMQMDLYKNASVLALMARNTAQAAGTYIMGVNGAILVNLVATDYIDVRITQNSGANINTDTSGTLSHVSIAKLF